jgi:hypothetical protein
MFISSSSSAGHHFTVALLLIVVYLSTHIIGCEVCESDFFKMFSVAVKNSVECKEQFHQELLSTEVNKESHYTLLKKEDC